MANPTTVTVTVVDNDNDEATFSFYLASTINTIASIEAAAQSIIEDAQALITGTITRVQIAFPLDISGWTLAAAAGQAQDRAVGGRFIYGSLATPNAKKELNLPTFDIESFVISPGKNIDTANATVQALMASIQGTTYTNSTDVELDTLLSAVETYGGKSR